MEYEFLKHHIIFEYLTPDTNLSLNPLIIGYERCEKNKGNIGPICRDRYILQYVFEGQGNLTLAGRSYRIKKNTLLYLPTEELVYSPNKEDPWSYIWIEFTGLHAGKLLANAKFSPLSPIFSPKHPEEFFAIFAEMIEDICKNKRRNFYQYSCAASLMKIFYLLISERNTQEEQDLSEENKILPAVKYIEDHYADPDISLQKICDLFYWSPPYLSRLFKKVMSVPPTKYIISLRMKKAQEMLQSKSFKISAIATACGYSSPYYFSLEFKRNIGITPSKYHSQAIE